MVVVSPILTEVRNLAIQKFVDEVTKIQVGDDNTAPTIADSSIGNLVDEASIESVDISVPGQVTFGVKFGITSFVGDTIREVTLADSTEIKTRDLTVESLKGSDQIFWVRVTVKARARNFDF